MIIYQVKIKIDQEVEAEWIEWMKQVHIPDMIATGLVKSSQILQPMEEPDAMYYFNYYFEGMTDFEKYERNHAPALRAHPQEMFPNRFEASRQIFTII